ncbi:hypothetical protein JCM18237_24760 [Halorubrum luteum]
MLSQPDGGSSDDHRRKPVAPRHQLAENHLDETDGNDAFEAQDTEVGRGIARRMGFLSYGIAAVTLASVVLILERDLVPVPESALSWVTIAGAATMMLIALARYGRTHSRQSAE